MAVFNTAGNRAIMIGIALGIVATSLKILIGVAFAFWEKISVGRMSEFLKNQWWVVALFIGSMVPLARRFASVGFTEALRTLDRRWIFC